MKLRINRSVVIGNPLYDGCEIQRRGKKRYQLKTPANLLVPIIKNNLQTLLTTTWKANRNRAFDVVTSGSGPSDVVILTTVAITTAQEAGIVNWFTHERDDDHRQFYVPVSAFRLDLRKSLRSNTAPS